MTPSILQQNILSRFRGSNDNLIIQACAGSGKTTTIELLCKQTEPAQQVLAVAFNKAIASTFEQRLPKHVTCKTLHAVGLQMCKDMFGRIKVDNSKITRIISDYFGDKRVNIGDYRKVLSLVVNMMLDAYNIGSITTLCDYFCIEEVEPEHIGELLSICRDDTRNISFDDMLDFPVFYDYMPRKFDTVFVDEAQDLNMLQLELINKLLGRLVAVGDRRQAIYAFRGADASSMDNIKERFSCYEMPLSVCYRCDSLIVEEAQKIAGVDSIQVRDGAALGTVRTVSRGHSHNWTNQMVLCRVNVHLVKLCFELIKKGIKATIRGRDIGQGLIDLMNKVERKTRPSDWPDLIGKMQSYVMGMVHKMQKAGNDQGADQALDQLECFNCFAYNCESKQETEDAILSLFSDERGSGVLLSSIHKAKGLENDTVIILGPELLPHPKTLASGNEALIEQEKNLQYVAVTRALHELIFQPLEK